MVGSRKAGICPDCKGRSIKAYKSTGTNETSEAAVFCSMCQNHGKIDLGRPYSVFYGSNQEGGIDQAYTDQLRRDPSVLVKQCSIRFPPEPISAVTVIQLPCEVVTFLRKQSALEKAANKRSNKTTTSPVPTTVHDDNACSNPNIVGPSSSPQAQTRLIPIGRSTGRREYSLETVPSTDEKYRIIAEYVREKQGRPEISHVKKTTIGDLYIVSTSCRFCPNKGSEHNSSTNFFVLRPTGLERRCYCKKPEQRLGGVLCSEWISDREELPINVAQLLFSRAAIEKRRVLAMLERAQNSSSAME